MNAPEDEARFDQYSVIVVDHEYHVMQLLKNVELMPAVMMAGITQEDFVESMSQTGWVGTCPHWSNHYPVVTLPRKARLTHDHLEFMMESLSQNSVRI